MIALLSTCWYFTVFQRPIPEDEIVKESTYIEAKSSIPEPDYLGDLGTYLVDEPFIGTIVSFTDIEDYTIIIKIKDERGVIEKFYFNTYDMCNADRSWLPYILIEGHKVLVKYYLSGNGGYQYILSIENIK